jgi:hypothetical protein
MLSMAQAVIPRSKFIQRCSHIFLDMKTYYCQFDHVTHIYVAVVQFVRYGNNSNVTRNHCPQTDCAKKVGRTVSVLWLENCRPTF